MLEELQRRNYAKTTVDAYIHAVEQFAKHFKRRPDRLTVDHLRTYQAYFSAIASWDRGRCGYMSRRCGSSS